MLKIGLTGGIASGKSTAAKLFANKGITVIDADQIARDIVTKGTPAYQKIVMHFGENILSNDQNINRSALRELIFQNASEKNWLEQLLHPIIRDEMNAQALQAQPPYCLLMIPLLTAKDSSIPLDRILVVDCDPTLQIQRAMQRDNNDKAKIQAIIDSQISREQRLAFADDIIINNKDLSHLQSRVDELHDYYTSMCV